MSEVRDGEETGAQSDLVVPGEVKPLDRHRGSAVDILCERLLVLVRLLQAVSSLIDRLQVI